MAKHGSAGTWRERYELIDALGEGGVAQVYSARNRETGQFVAVKVMRQELAHQPEERERFRREAIAIREIDSPHVCSVFEFDVSGDEVYMVMEFVEGVTLRTIIKTIEWTVPDVGIVLGQVGQALHAAHVRGIVHRDLKPENIVLTGAGLARQVKVLDFGFAKLLAAERDNEIDELTKVGSVFGTPQYMSPEQIMGKPVTAKSDLFALAVIAYEIIVGSRPWNGSSPTDVMLAVATCAPPGIEEARCGLLTRRAELERFFATALHKDPDQRFADAQALCRELNKALGIAEDRSVEDPRDWFEEGTRAGVFGEDADVDTLVPANTSVDADVPLRSTWHTQIVEPDSLDASEDDEDDDDAATLYHVSNRRVATHIPHDAAHGTDDDGDEDHQREDDAVEPEPKRAPKREKTAIASLPKASDARGRTPWAFLVVGALIGAALAIATVVLLR